MSLTMLNGILPFEGDLPVVIDGYVIGAVDVSTWKIRR